jgi:plastocyanin
MSTRLHIGIGVSALALAVMASTTTTPAKEVGWQDHPAFAAQAAAAGAARGSAGAVTGRIKYEGKAPPPRPVRMGSDPMCAKVGAGVTSELLLVGAGGGLQNVFVYVKDGLGNRTFPAPKTPVNLDQRGCRYIPHVFGVQAGQPVRIANSDPTLHNVHALPKINPEINFAQMKATPAVTKTFAKPEVGIPVRCDVHGWMNAYVGVVNHPFFAVSKPDGSFEIKGLPAGTYTLEAWHERLGTQTQKITVDAKGTGTAAFSFKPRA